MSDAAIISNVVKRFADAMMGSDDFIAEVRKHLRIGNDKIYISSLYSSSGVITINYYSTPDEKNGTSLTVTGFGDWGASPPSGKVKVKQEPSSLSRQYMLRTKVGNPQAIARYITDYLNMVHDSV